MISKPKGTVDLIDKKARTWKYVEEVIRFCNGKI